MLVVLPVLPRQNVAVANHGDATQGGILGLSGLKDVVPVRELAVALQTTAAVQLHWKKTRKQIKCDDLQIYSKVK